LSHPHPNGSLFEFKLTLLLMLLLLLILLQVVAKCVVHYVLTKSEGFKRFLNR
jgi:TRAP-type C4-dicarboxylate transport system permease small subunit